MAVGTEHQALIELFRNRPSLAFELLGRPAGAVEVLAADVVVLKPKTKNNTNSNALCVCIK